MCCILTIKMKNVYFGKKLNYQFLWIFIWYLNYVFPVIRISLHEIFLTFIVWWVGVSRILLKWPTLVMLKITSLQNLSHFCKSCPRFYCSKQESITSHKKTRKTCFLRDHLFPSHEFITSYDRTHKKPKYKDVFYHFQHKICFVYIIFGKNWIRFCYLYI